MKVTPKQRVDAINAYTQELEPVISIAARYNITRQGIWKILRKAGVNTSKGAGGASQIDISCAACNKEITRHRCQIRKHKRLFCSIECYYAYLEAHQSGTYQQSRQGQRIARQKIAVVFNLLPKHIVHHEDRNALNNMLSNLKVFANQGDHIRYHRGMPDNIYEVRVLWEDKTF